uniref:DNA/RNA non-specific endonuclease/pyrophosphatase/phosphodiesterase domain-containing protein n=1 Tax=Anopheles culicifacies TaxID=139723 RepID=A0A182MPX5_9DIPT
MFLPIVLITLSTLLHSATAGCRVYLNGNLTQQHAPLFLKQSGNQYQLLQPSGPFFQWCQSESVVVGCSPAKNTLTNTGSDLVNISCIENLEFSIAGSSKRTALSDISCSSAVSGAIKPLDKPCANGLGQLYDIGFNIKGSSFVKYFQVCYNTAKSSALYSEHQILGHVISHAQINNNRPAFKLGGMTSTVRLASVYTQRHQQERFATLLGSSEQANKYINSTSYLAKGHLTPDGDAVLDTWAGATYFFINAAPEWQVVNGGNWLRVENAARKVAAQLNDTVHVYSGVYDILQLAGKNGRPVSLSLGDDGSVEVPKWLWKVIVHQPTGRGIALISLNNPFADRVEALCEDICSQYGWHQKEFQDLRKGYTYCCSVTKAQKAISLIPKTIKSNNVLVLE